MDAYLKKHDYKSVETLIEKLELSREKADFFDVAAQNILSENGDMQQAKYFSEKSTSTIDSLRSLQLDNYSVAQWKNFIDNAWAEFAKTYSITLEKTGQGEEAERVINKAVELIGDGDREINEQLLRLLLVNKKYNEALKKATRLIEENKVNTSADSLYKVAYISVNGSDKGFQDTLQKLVAKKKARAKKDLISSFIDKPALEFTLKDLDGNEVVFSSDKKKIVVLDFWATWCEPCVASFPAMQQLVSKYANRHDVEFYFINTFENTTPEKVKENIREMLKKNNYTFNVLLDVKSSVSALYGVVPIPTKIIIGKDGKIKFNIVGYNGNVQSAIEEMDDIIEVLQ